MKTGKLYLLAIGLMGVILLSACGPSQAQLDATATQIAANIFATQNGSSPHSHIDLYADPGSHRNADRNSNGDADADANRHADSDTGARIGDLDTGQPASRI